jgi:hypothetical protein
MASGWHTRSSTGGPAELRFDHFKVPIEVIFGDIAGRSLSKQPMRPHPDAAMLASRIHACAILHWTRACLIACAWKSRPGQTEKIGASYENRNVGLVMDQRTEMIGVK